MEKSRITIGTELYVPAGADMIRSRPYYCRVTGIDSTTDYVHMSVEKIRGDGTASNRQPAAGSDTVTFYAIVDAEKIRERIPTADVGPGTPYDDSGLMRPPADACEVSAIRAMPGNEMRQYSRVGFHSRYAGVEHLIRTLRAVGYIRPSSTTTVGYAVLDIYNDTDDIIFDYDIPTARAFSYLKRRIGLTVEPEPQETDRAEH